MTSSMGRVVTSGVLGGKQGFMLHILDYHSCVAYLDEQPPGSSILRIEVKSQSQKKAELQLSYKYKTLIHNHVFHKFTFRVMGNMGVKCKTNPKNYKEIRKLHTEFIPSVRLFITEFVSNHNYTEKELTSVAEIENELLYRKFVIFPLKNRVVIKRKVGNDIKTASIGIDFDHMKYFVEEGSKTTDIKSFNEYLISFLEINTSDKLLVRATLGYSRPTDVFAPGESSLIGSGEQPKRAPRNPEAVPVRSRDKDKLIEKLKEEIRSMGTMPQWKMPPGPVRNMLRTILEATSSLQSGFEQMDWISRGILDVLIQVMVLNGNTDIYNEIPIKICKFLLDKNPDGCEIFCQQCFRVVEGESTWECVGVYHALVVMIELNGFREVFVKLLGPSRMLQVYVRASFTLVGEHSPSSHSELLQSSTATALSDSTSTSPRFETEQDFDDGIDFDSPDELNDDIGDMLKVSISDAEISSPVPTELEELVAPSSARGSSVLIPKLSLPTAPQEGVPSRRNKARTNIMKEEEQFQRSATDEVAALAKNLGETYMTQDLTALLSYLQDDSESVKSRKHNRVTVNLATTSIFSEGDMMPLAPKVLGFRNSCYYKIKCSILNIFARLTKHWQYFDFITNPVNLLFSELLVSYRDCLLLYDDDFRGLIHSVLANYAQYVEYLHSMCWKKTVEGMTIEQTKSFRKRLDKFIWRVHHRLVPSVEMRDHTDIEIFLTLLVEYMRSCPTKVMSSQVADVSMEHLLRVRDLVLLRGRLTPNNIGSVNLIHQMVAVFDELAEQNTHGPMNSFLLSLLLENDEFRNFVKHYTGQILLNKTIEKFVTGIPRTVEGKQRLKAYRNQAIRHYRVCYRLMQSQVEFYKKEASRNVPFAKDAKESAAEYAHDFDFLLNPVGGYVLQLLTASKGLLVNFSLQKEILQFLIAVFSDKECWYLSRKAYVDAYLSYSYLTFIKLYHSVSYDEDTMELMRLHLCLLLAFSKNKNDKIRMKFYQLRVLDFLVREVNLEYEVTQSQERILIANSTEDEAPLSSNDLDATEKVEPKIPVWSGDDSKFKKGRGSRIRSAPYKLLAKSKSKQKADKKSKLAPGLELHPEEDSPPREGASAGHSAVEESSNEESTKVTISPDSNPATLGAFLASVSDKPAPSPKGASARPAPTGSKPKKSGSSLVIPGLSFDAATSFDGVAKQGSSVLAGGRSSSSSYSGEDSSEDDEGESSTEESGTAIQSSSPEDSAGTSDGSESGSEAAVESSAGEEEEEEESSSYYDSSSEKKPALPGLSLNLGAVPGSGSKVVAKAKPLGVAKLTMPKLENVPTKGGSAMPKLRLTDETSKNDIAAATRDLNTKGSTKVGVLSSIENKIDKNDPKFQLIFDNKEKQASAPARDMNEVDIMEMTQLYMKERNEHKIYSNTDIHMLVLRLIFSLMLDPIGTLDSLYCDQFPLDNKKLNIPFLLRYHLSHAANRHILPVLCDSVHQDGPEEFRLLKLLCPRLFRKEVYNDLHRLAIGAYGTVYRCRLKPDCQTMDVAIKLMEVPKTIHDRCVLHDIFDEIVILDKFSHDHRISRTYDFGTDDDYYWITMKRYKCSLKHWRKAQTRPLSENLALYLNIYMNVLNTFQFLSENKVNHFDVKCDNFLIQPLNEEQWSMEDEENFWNPTSDVPNFSVCLADFGESKVFDNDVDGYTTRNRGTEFTKSPEMLVVAYASQKTRNTYDRRKKVGASAPADVWALGCLLYELLTGEFLFYDQDWVRFFIRVTSPGQELITSEKIGKIDDNKVLLEFLNFVLCRDPQYRPSIHDVISRFKYVRARLTSSIRAEKEAKDAKEAKEEHEGKEVKCSKEGKECKECKEGKDGKDDNRVKEDAVKGRFNRQSCSERTEKGDKGDNPFAKFGVVLRSTKRPLSPTKRSEEDANMEEQSTAAFRTSSKEEGRSRRSIGGGLARLRKSLDHKDDSSSGGSIASRVRKSLEHKDDSAPSSPKADPLTSSDGHDDSECSPIASPKDSMEASPKSSPKLLQKEESKPLLLHSISQRKLQMEEEEVRIPLIEQFVDEATYFIKQPSRITDYMSIGSDVVASDRDTLRKFNITHIISCGDAAPPMAYVTMHARITKTETTLMIKALPELFKFINELRAKKGRVLICGEDGTTSSVAVAIAYLMHAHDWTYFEAFTYVKDRRYVIEPDEVFVNALCTWKRELQKKTSVRYQCLCGACSLIVTSAFHQSDFLNPRGCSCNVGDVGKCPNIGCKEFLDQMNKMYKFTDREVVWGYTTDVHLTGEYTRATVEYNAVKSLSISRSTARVEKQWTVFKCTSCDFLTHALRKKAKPDGPAQPLIIPAMFDAAVVTNLKTTGVPFSSVTAAKK